MNFGAELVRLLEQPGVSTKVEVSESQTQIRMDDLEGLGQAFIDQLTRTSAWLAEQQLGELSIIGSLSGEQWSASAFNAEDAYEPVRVIVTKAYAEHWLYFATLAGFEHWLLQFSAGQAIDARRLCVWVAASFAPFASYQHAIRPFGADRSLPTIEQLPEKPWKLVRDMTHAYTPASISPWLVLQPPSADSEVYAAWAAVATRNLAFCLPAEIRGEGTDVEAILRGGRSLPVAIRNVAWNLRDHERFNEACSWVYGTPREAETKFQLLNNHLAVNWVQGTDWPEGARQVLANSLAGAREAFAFYLQDQSKEAVKGLGELRKGLQEEVARTQAATRDLLSSVWRDFTIAGLVLALKTPGIPVTVDARLVQWLYTATAILLLVSVSVSGVSAFCFNALTNASRKDWRNKLYSFMSDQDWSQLVEHPIRAGRKVFWATWAVCFCLYAGVGWCLLYLAHSKAV